MFRGEHINFLARLTLGQPAVCPRAIWTFTRAKSLRLCAFFSRSKDPGNALRASPGIPLKSTAGNGTPKPYNSRHLTPPEHFQNSLPLSKAGEASFFRSGSGEGLSELVMALDAILQPAPSYISLYDLLLLLKQQYMLLSSSLDVMKLVCFKLFVGGKFHGQGVGGVQLLEAKPPHSAVHPHRPSAQKLLKNSVS